MTNPDFVALAKAMRVHAIRCDSLDELPAKMKEFMEYDNNKPVLFEARIVKTEHVSFHFSFPFSLFSLVAFFSLVHPVHH